MVFFTCSQCGQSVKKNQVEKHVSFQCRNCQSLSCMDCGKEFWGDEYQEHTKCVSEDQKYGGKNFVPKPTSNKGEIKQEKWIEHIKSTIATKKISGPLSQLLNSVIEYPNIPRKKSKFVNFLQNSLKVRNFKLINETWEIFELSTKNESSKANTSVNGTNGINGAVKRPAEESENAPNKQPHIESLQNNIENGNSFDWCESCEKILENYPEGIPEKQLRREVMTQYKSSLGDQCNLTNSEFKKQLREMLSNNSKFSLYVNSKKTAS